MKNRLIILFVCGMLWSSCSFDKKTETTSEASGEVETPDLKIGQGDQPEVAARLASLLTGELIADEVEFLAPEQRTFRYAQADLNENGELEYLIELRNSFFCGTGGCTYFLVTSSGELITSFSVSDAPFYVLAEKSNGWHDLVIPRDGVFNLIQHDGSAYPSNPSMQPEVQLDGQNILGTLISESNTQEYTF